ncbi:amidohydrolase [Streptomyces sp. NPDC094437]|uniref:amidohydrolase n=1 Tax=Streptomyces sp. NPDC094437 TaxID=3366060 RepID=UPI003802D16B
MISLNVQPEAPHADETSTTAARPEADLIFHGGEIVTVAGTGTAPGPEAVAVKDGVIVYVGDLAGAEGWEGPGTRRRDLRGQALLPGFIDAHGHLGGIGLQATIANLLADPDGDVTDLASLKAKLSEWAESDVGKQAKWIVGFGYDDAMLAEGRHPTREDLDQVSTNRPVLAIHQSYHLGAVNSEGLRLLGFDSTFQDPEGGVIRRRPRTPEEPFKLPFGEPDGVLEETAFEPASKAATEGLPLSASAGLFMKGVASAARFGFTTVQEGGVTLANLKLLRQLAPLKPFKVDVVAYVRADEATAAVADDPARDPVGVDTRYRFGVRAAGVKMYLDGSPQGRTAWLTEPYTTPPEGKPADYRGYRRIKDDEAVQQVGTAYRQGWQVLAHVNGDASIDQYIEAVETAIEACGPGDRRTVAVHAQTARADQLDRFKDLGIIPSFFPLHTFYWGDWYRHTVLGPERAAHISPAKWALDRGMIYTAHHDAPVALPNSIMILSSQVTRRTRTDGIVLGAGQCVSALDAVRSITLNAAHQYGEQDSKGSIEVGKLADLVVLTGNPLTVDPDEIKDIRVAETFKRGESIHPVHATTQEDAEPGPAVPADYPWHCSC